MTSSALDSKTEVAHGDADTHALEEHADGEALRIPVDVQQRFGIQTAVVGPGRVEVVRELPGEVVLIPDRVVHVKPPFNGTIQRVAKHVGDWVEAGEVLAVLESAQALAPYSIKAGIAGTVTEKHAAVGEAVELTHELFTIGDTRQVWAQLQVFPSDLSRIDKGDPVEIVPPGRDSGVWGEISFVSPVLDRHTRTATARVVLENAGQYQPGLFVTGRVVVSREEADLSIPTTALVRAGREWVVFVRTGGDVFEERPVDVALRGLERSHVQSGLSSGEEVVTNGAFLVKSAAARAEMGGGHSH